MYYVTWASEIINRERAFSDKFLTLVHQGMLWRMNLMHDATSYARLLDPDFKACERFDVDAHLQRLVTDHGGREGPKFELWGLFNGMLGKSEIWANKPGGKMLWKPYYKPSEYLAVAMMEKNLTREQAEAFISRLRLIKQANIHHCLKLVSEHVTV